MGCSPSGPERFPELAEILSGRISDCSESSINSSQLIGLSTPSRESALSALVLERKRVVISRVSNRAIARRNGFSMPALCYVIPAEDWMALTQVGRVYRKSRRFPGGVYLGDLIFEWIGCEGPYLNGLPHV
jgi:hypothetical protein